MTKLANSWWRIYQLEADIFLKELLKTRQIEKECEYWTETDLQMNANVAPSAAMITNLQKQL